MASYRCYIGCTMKRRKPQAQRKEDSIRIRVTADQKRALNEKAKRRGLGVSSWLLSLGLSAPEQPMSQISG